MSEKDEGRLWPVAYVFLFFLTAGVILWRTLKMPSYLFLMGTIGVFAALGHYLVAKIIGPLVVGRLWCGWGCWTFAFLNLLPFKRSKGKAKEAPSISAEQVEMKNSHILQRHHLASRYVRGLEGRPGYHPHGDERHGHRNRADHHPGQQTLEFPPPREESFVIE